MNPKSVRVALAWIRRDQGHTFRRLIVVACALLSPAIVINDIARNARSVPFWDEWEHLIVIGLHAAEGILNPAELFLAYNDSRPLFTNLVTALSARYDQLNFAHLLYLNVAIAAASYVLLADLYRRYSPDHWQSIVVPLSVIVFSYTQRRSWLWPFQSQHFFVTLFVVAAIWIVWTRPVGWRTLVLAALAALAATYSYANGFLIWLVLAPLLVGRGYRLRSHVAMWIGTAAVILVAFFATFAPVSLSSSLRLDGVVVAHSLLVFLGNALLPAENLTHSGEEVFVVTLLGGAGLVTIAWNVVAIRNTGGGIRNLAPWLALAAFVVLSGILVGIGRGAHLGIDSVMASRYVTSAIVFWAALVGICLTGLLAAPVPGHPLSTVNGFLLASVLAVTVVGGIRFSSTRATITAEHESCFLRYPDTRDDTCLRDLHPAFETRDPHHLILASRIDQLKARQLAAFAGR